MSDRLTLTELQLIIKDTIYLGLPDMYWVIAEISEIKENYAGHCYLELVEKQHDDTNIKARVRAVIWAKKYSFLRSLFENVTGETLKEGLKILLKVTVEYHEIYGLSLVVNDIDPSFTVGELAIRRNQIIKKLEAEGVFSMNKEIPFPKLPQRIAIVSSRTAAGYTDFLKQLTGNIYGYTFKTILYEASMQGADTEKSVIAALDLISENTNSLDVVVIIRGGGAQTDLSWFDNYNIAYHITQFPLPVITGIGHEKDVTVTDMVAYRNLKTPTAVADFLINAVSETENELKFLSERISELTISALRENEKRLDNSRMKLIPVAGMMITGLKNILSAKSFALFSTGKENMVGNEIILANLEARLTSGTKKLSEEINERIQRYLADLQSVAGTIMNQAALNLDSIDRKLAILDPENVLKRGFTLTSRNGLLVKSPGVLSDGDVIDTRFYEGSVKSKVMRIKK